MKKSLLIFIFFFNINCSNKKEQKTTLKLEIKKLQKELFVSFKIYRPSLDTLSYENCIKRIDFTNSFIFLEKDFNNDKINDGLFIIPSSNCIGKGSSDKSTLIYSDNGTFYLDTKFSKKIETLINKELLNEKITKPKRTLISFNPLEFNNYKNEVRGFFHCEFDSKKPIIGDFKYIIQNKIIEIKLKKLYE